jgi:hypothetical protein
MAKTDLSDTHTAAPPKKPRRKRASRHIVLAEVTEDVNTKQAVYAILEMPPLPTNKPISAAVIQTATQKAVYEDGKRDYGNKRLVAIHVLDTWEVSFEERTALLPPTK